MTDSKNGESTFEALDKESDATLGPPGVLLIGFDSTETGNISELLTAAGAPGHQVVTCTTTMGEWTVEKALLGNDEGRLLPVGGVPRVMLLSGLTDRQVDSVLDSYNATGLPRPIFAVTTPENLGFTVLQLLEDLMAEREAL